MRRVLDAIEGQMGAALDCFNDERADRDVGDEPAIHHINVNPVPAGRFSLGYLAAQPRKISG